MPARFLAAVAAVSSLLLLPAAAGAAKPSYYVSLGDSYAAGYQRFSATDARTTRAGFAYQLVGQARKRGYRFELANFGCGGETTESILTRTAACAGLGPGGVNYAGRSQAAAAQRFLRRHPLPYPSYVDPDEDISRWIEAPANYPITVFRDARGKTVFIHQGLYRSDAELRTDIDRYLGT
jgi:hypothetical protein